LIAAICAAVSAAIFLLEVYTPQGLSESALYSVVVFLALWAQRSGFLIAVSALCSGLVVLGFFSSPDGPEPLIGAINRGFSLLTIWLLTANGLVMQSFQSHRDRLQHEVDIREEDLRLARNVQQKLFPSTIPQVSGFDIAGVCRPADSTGGDYYDFIPLTDDCLGIAVGDVSGHGIGPALLMAETHAVLRVLALAHTDVGAMLTLANRLVCEYTEDDRFITLFLGRLDPRQRSFVFASAGHQAYLLDASGVVTNLDSTAAPLGIDRMESIACVSPIYLDEGSIVFLPTDGLFDAIAPDGSSFGLPRALDLIRANRTQPAKRIVEILCDAVGHFAQGSPQTDDITVVVIKALSPNLPSDENAFAPPIAPI